MIAGLGALSVAYALDVTIPFPAEPVFEGEQRVCLDVAVPFTVSSTEVEDSGFRISCSTVSGERSDSAVGYFQPPEVKHVVRACATVLQGTRWPARMPEYTCASGMQKIVVKPVIGFDPNDDITDGVEILSAVDTIAAAFRVPDLPDAPGILPGGSCGIERGILWIDTGRARASADACVLVFEDRELAVPIRMVPRLERRDSSR